TESDLIETKTEPEEFPFLARALSSWKADGRKGCIDIKKGCLLEIRAKDVLNGLYFGALVGRNYNINNNTPNGSRRKKKEKKGWFPDFYVQKVNTAED